MPNAVDSDIWSAIMNIGTQGYVVMDDCFTLTNGYIRRMEDLSRELSVCRCPVRELVITEELETIGESVKEEYDSNFHKVLGACKHLGINEIYVGYSELVMASVRPCVDQPTIHKIWEVPALLGTWAHNTTATYVNIPLHIYLDVPMVHHAYNTTTGEKVSVHPFIDNMVTEWPTGMYFYNL